MLSVDGSDQLRAVVLAVKQARRDVRNDIARATRAEMSPVWTAAVGRRARTETDRAVLTKGARIVAGNPPAAVAATSKRKLSGGLVPVETWRAVEFGGNTKRTTYRRRSPGGGTHQVTRNTAAQLPARRLGGRVVYPAIGELAPRLASLWVQLVVRKFYDAVEGGGR